MAALLPIFIFVIAVAAINFFEFKRVVEPDPHRDEQARSRRRPGHRRSQAGRASDLPRLGRRRLCGRHPPAEARRPTPRRWPRRSRPRAAAPPPSSPTWLNHAQTTGLIAKAADAVGPLTLLVNNASHFGDDDIESLTPESWAEHMGPNLLAPLLLIQAFAKAAASFAERSNPSVVNILDQRVLRPNPQFLSYTLSKSALYTATQTLAQALAPRIRVNGVGPGPTLPSVHQDQAAFDAEVAGVPMHRKTELSDITGAVLYLANARAVTGQMIAVDNAQHLGWKTPDIIGD